MGIRATGASRKCASERVQRVSVQGQGWDGRAYAQGLGEGWALERSSVLKREGSGVKGCTVLEALQRWWLCSLPLPLQHLQEARDGLHTTVELLQVRVQSLLHILTMQEEELARKVGPHSGPLTPRCFPVGRRGWCAARTCQHLPLRGYLFWLWLLLLGQDRKKTPPLSSAPPGAHTTAPLLPPCRFNLQIPWSWNSPGSARPC